jgi:hypothetical protein
VVPLSSYGKQYTAPAGDVDSKVDVKTAVREQVNKLDGVAYFKLLAELMKTNPPNPADAAMLPKLANVGLVPGQDFDSSKLDPAIVKGIDAAPAAAQEKIMSWLKEGMLVGDFTFHDGWAYTTKAGTYGTSYRQRALITAIGLGANRPQDAIYPVSEGPGMFSKYEGKKHYVLHFEKGKRPPANGFWSLTMYDKDFVDNPLNRYTLTQRNELKPNADGSVDLYIQNESPGKEKDRTGCLRRPRGSS